MRNRGILMRLLLQFPEGLKQKALEYAKKYEDDGHEVYLSSSKSFGGCDVALEEARLMKVDKIIHFGHSEFPIHPSFNKDIPVEYVEYHIDIDEEFIRDIADHARRFSSVGLVTVVQHIHQLGRIKKEIEEKGVNVFIGKGPRCAHPGQILGCDSFAATSLEGRVDAIYYIGGGRFHYLAIHKVFNSLKIPVFSANPHTKNIKEVTNEIKNYVKQRRAMVITASEGNIFGILVSTRPGQFAPETAKQIHESLIKKGKRAYILVSYSIDPEALQDFNVFDAYINTACPRIADDWERIGKPVVNANEIEFLFKLL